MQTSPVEEDHPQQEDKARSKVVVSHRSKLLQAKRCKAMVAVSECVTWMKSTPESKNSALSTIHGQHRGLSYKMIYDICLHTGMPRAFLGMCNTCIELPCKDATFPPWLFMLRGPFLKPDLSGLRKESHRHRLPFDRRGFFEPFVFATAALPLHGSGAQAPAPWSFASPTS